jgi:hypothetical protein
LPNLQLQEGNEVMSAPIGHNSTRRQTVYRTHGNRAHTAILNTFLQDGRISHEAKGLIAEMLSYPSDWEFTVAYLVKNGRSGRDKIYRMLKEAEKFGYIIPFQYRALDGKIQRQTYLVSDDPEALIRAVAEEIQHLEKQDNWERKEPLPEKPEVAGPLPSNPLPRKPDTANQEVDMPLPEKPDTAQPDTANPRTTKNIYNKNTSNKEREVARTPSEETRLAEDWQLPKEYGQWAMHYCKRDRDWVIAAAAKFKDYWLSVPDNKGFKKNWKATWQNWCRNTLEREAKYQKPTTASWRDEDAERRKKLRDALEKVKAEYNG